MTEVVGLSERRYPDTEGLRVSVRAVRVTFQSVGRSVGVTMCARVVGRQCESMVGV